MFGGYDICLCGNADECPHKNECLRNQKRVGINTYSNFYNKDDEKCIYFIERRSDNNA